MANRRKEPSKPTVPHRTSAEGCAGTVTANRWRLELAKLVPSTHSTAPAESCLRLAERSRGCGDCRKGEEVDGAECFLRRASACRPIVPRRLRVAAGRGSTCAAPRYRRRGRAQPVERDDAGAVTRHGQLS